MKKLIFLLLLIPSICFSQFRIREQAIVDSGSVSAPSIVSEWDSTGIYFRKDSILFSIDSTLVTTFTTNGFSGLIGTADTRVLYNNSGSLGSNDSLTYDYTNVCLGIGEYSADDYANLLIADTQADEATGHTSIYVDHWRDGGTGTGAYTDGLYIYNALNVDAGVTTGYLSGGTIWNVNTAGNVGTSGTNRDMVGFEIQNANYDTVYGDLTGLKVVADNNSSDYVEDDIFGIYIDVDNDGDLDGTAYGLYINSQSNIDYGAYIEGNVGITGTVTGKTVYKEITQIFDMTSGEDTLKIVPNFKGTVTIDSIYVEGRVLNQAAKIFTIPNGGGSATLIDDFLSSVTGTDRFSKMETTLTSSVWANKTTAYILKQGTDTEFSVTLFVHYTEQKGS